MVHVDGGSEGDYLNLKCRDCGDFVVLGNLRRDGAVPLVDAECRECGTTGAFKLMPATWMDILPEKF